ncbi:MAG: alkaline phosphatase [bacterium]|nr:alkaline phosphatase [bacterium]
MRETLQQQRPGDRQAAPFAEPLLTGVPSLTDMARGALNVLDADPDGFFLMIEGGAVDWAAHDNQPGRLVEEVVGFAEAVAAVRRWIDANGGWERNLLLITADHETGYLTGPSPAEDPPASPPPSPAAPRRRESARTGVPFPEPRNAGACPWRRRGGNERLPGLAGHRDPVRGPYLDNTAIGLLLQDLAAR